MVRVFNARHHKSVWRLWTSLSAMLHRNLDRSFYKLSKMFARHPKLTIGAFGLLCASLLSCLLLAKVETRTYKLYYPSESRTAEDFKMAEKYFQIRCRLAEFILEPMNSSNVLDGSYMRFASEVHRHIINATNIQSVCIRQDLDRSSCLTLTPMELFDDRESLADASREVSRRYVENALMANGRPTRFNIPAVFSSIRNTSRLPVASATAMRFMYFINFPLDDEDAMATIMDWEKVYVDYMASMLPIAKAAGLHLYYQATRSEDDATIVSTFDDAKLVAVTLALIIVLTVSSFTNLFRPHRSHGLLALFGLVLVFIGIAAAFGLGLILRVPLTSITGVVPFLVLGVAVDDIFIILDYLQRSDPRLTPVERIASVYEQCGSTITMTTITDAVAFFVSSWTVFPGIEYFCLYTALSLLVTYGLLMTVFVAMMYYDLAWRQTQELKAIESADNAAPPFARKIFHWWGTVVIRTWFKIVVAVAAFTLLAVLTYFSFQLDTEFDFTLAAGDTYVYVFMQARKRLFDTYLDVQWVISPQVNLAVEATQDKILNAVTIACSDRYYENLAFDWLSAFRKWAELTGNPYSGAGFYSSLSTFLESPHSAMFRRDILLDYSTRHAGYLLDTNSSNHVVPPLLTSRITLLLPLERDSFFFQEALIATRELQEHVLPKPTYIVHTAFYFFEQLPLIVPMTSRNVAVCGLSILILTAPFLVHPALIAFMAVGFCGLIVQLAGLMALWDVSLNLVSMVILVIAIGFSIDYSAHVGHAYITSKANSPDEKVIDALTNIGSSVFLGGFSTFLGVIVLAFAETRPFLIFFKMLFGIVFIGLLNGLVILPVFISTCCRWTPTGSKSKQSRTRDSQTQALVEPDCSQETAQHCPVEKWLSSDIPESDV